MPDLSSLIGAPELAPPALAPTPIAPSSTPDFDVAGAINAAAAKYGVDPRLANAIAYNGEGGGKSYTSPTAVSPMGATGVMQLMPKTWQQYGVQDPTNPGQNIDAGVHYIADLSKQFNGDPELTAAAYNAGPEQAAKFGKNWTQYAKPGETTPYVQRVQGAMAPNLAGILGAPELVNQAPAPITLNVPGNPASLPPPPVTAEQTATMRARQGQNLFDATAPKGSDLNPYAEQPGVPVPAGKTWVGLDGEFHPGPRSIPQVVGNALSGIGQGLGPDLAAGMAKLGAADPRALAAASGAPFQPDADTGTFASDVNRSLSAQQTAYGIRHAGQSEAQAGRFLGQAAPATAAALAVPELEVPAALSRVPLIGKAAQVAARVGTNALRGTAAAATNVGSNSAPVGQQLAAGAILGGAAPELIGAGENIAAKVAGVGGFGRTVSPDVAALADAAQTKYGINLRSGQVMGANGDRAAATADSNMLGSNPKVLANNDAQRAAWMKGVTGTYGDTSGDVSPDALTAARTRIGGVMNDVASRSSINADAVQTKVGDIIADAQKVLPDNEVAPLLKLAENIGSVRQGTTISGDAYQALTRTGAPLDRLIQSADPNVSHYASMIRDALDDGLQASAAPQDVAALQQARFQYKNLMTVARLAPKAGVDGVISPALLRGTVTTNFKNAAFQGAGDLGELAQIGQTFMKEPPNSFSANRANDFLSGLKNAVTGAGLTEAGMTLAHHPEQVLPSALAGVGAATAKAAGDALKASRIAGPASGIIARSLPGSPGTAASALAGYRAVKPIAVPLSALNGARLLPSLNALPAPANAP